MLKGLYVMQNSWQFVSALRDTFNQNISSIVTGITRNILTKFIFLQLPVFKLQGHIRLMDRHCYEQAAIRHDNTRTPQT